MALFDVQTTGSGRQWCPVADIEAETLARHRTAAGRCINAVYGGVIGWGKHFHEKLVADHGFTHSCNWVRLRELAPRQTWKRI